jgi:hypothetical protein
MLPSFLFIEQRWSEVTKLIAIPPKLGRRQGMVLRTWGGDSGYRIPLERMVVVGT